MIENTPHHNHNKELVNVCIFKKGKSMVFYIFLRLFIILFR